MWDPSGVFMMKMLHGSLKTPTDKTVFGLYGIPRWAHFTRQIGPRWVPRACVEWDLYVAFTRIFCATIQTLSYTKSKKWKIGQKWVWPRSSNRLFKLLDPLIFLERMQIETTNFAGWLILSYTKQKMKKMVKSGRGLCHVTDCVNFRAP